MDEDRAKLSETPEKPLTKLEVKEVVEDEISIGKREPVYNKLPQITDEFKAGFELLMDHPKSVTVFGSARFQEDNIYYKEAWRICEKISKLGYSIVTGGGPGIMEAANRGAYDAGGASVSMSIKLPREQMTNKFVKDDLQFHYFFARKVILAFSAEAYIFFPGGFGTMDEFFEIMTLVQTKKIPFVPIILYGKEYWETLHKFLSEELCKKYKTLDPQDLELYTLTDDEDEILKLIKEAPIRL